MLLLMGQATVQQMGDTVGALMKRLGRQRQVLAVTHLAQVAACADHHYLVSKMAQADGHTASSVAAVAGEPRVAEVARMLGGERGAGTSLAHAQAMLLQALAAPVDVAAAALPGRVPASASASASAAAPAKRRRSKA